MCCAVQYVSEIQIEIDIVRAEAAQFLWLRFCFPPPSLSASASFYPLYNSLSSICILCPQHSFSPNAAFMVIDISEQILWFRRVTHEDCARADGMKGTTDDGLNVSGRTTAKEEEGMAHFKRIVQKTEKCGLALQGISVKLEVSERRLLRSREPFPRYSVHFSARNIRRRFCSSRDKRGVIQAKISFFRRRRERE